MRRIWVLLLLCYAAPALAVTINGGGTSTPLSDVSVTGSATLVRAANGNRLTLSCTNTSSTDAVRWGGDSSVSATKGQRLPAGASIEIRSLDDVYMISEGGTVEMSCTEETP